MLPARRLRSLAAALSAVCVASCSSGGSGVIPPPAPSIGVGVVDESAQSCAVSFDSMVWYTLPSGTFSPIDVRAQRCSGLLRASPSPGVPAWAQPSGATRAIFVATSLQQRYSVAGMQTIEAAASASRVPVSWMIANPVYLGNAALYDQYHQSNGDDVEVADDPSLVQAAQSSLPWYKPSVSVEGAGHERNIAQALSLGETGFWGITWNQSRVDLTNDVGAPWGTYCADVTSYKRPAPDGTCTMLAFEWTARDLTRAYLSGHSEYFSTDPDDLQQRADFDTAGAERYVRAIVDAYAAAGQTQPLVMVSQQESAEDTNPGDQAIMAALYAQTQRDGMHAETLAQANAGARGFSELPRAVAFPYIPGGTAVPSPVLGQQTLYPATIDYHDTVAGMTFLAGHTTPTRVFRYADDPHSSYDTRFPAVPAAQMPMLTSVAVANGAISLTFQAPAALHYGIALWTDPAPLGLSGSGVTAAGHAGVVLTFDLQPGANQISFPCPGCTSTTFRYST